MRAYRATVQILLPADIKDEVEAADALSGALSETLKYEGAILDWAYLRDDSGRYGQPELVDLGDVEEWDDDRSIADLPVVKFGHAYDFSFRLESNRPQAEDVTAEMLRAALLTRIRSLSDRELHEACGLYETTEVGE